MISSFQLRGFGCFLFISTSALAAPPIQPLTPFAIARPQHSTTNLHILSSTWAREQRAFPLGYIPTDAKVRALEQIQQTHANRKPIRPLVAGGPQWVNIGPAPIINGQIAPSGPVSGRVLGIAVDPANQARWLVGSAQGGVWETLDTGATWSAKSDDQASLAIGAIAFAPANSSIIFAGTGEPNFGSQDGYAGAGLLKSVNGGSTWQLLGGTLFSGKSFGSIIVSPASSSVLLVAITGGFAGRGTDRPPSQPGLGIFKSTDGGATWAQKVTGFSTDLKADPSNFNHQMATAASNPFGPTYALSQSLDGGDTWKTITGPWNNSGGAGRMQLAISPSNPDTLYVSSTDFSGNEQTNANFNRLLGIWRTDNAWAATPTWTQLPQPQNVGNQVWYDHVISVDPANRNVLYFGETPLWKFNGTTWSVVGGDYDPNANGKTFHSDQHAQAWAGNRLIIGNDGGVWSTTDGGATFFNHNSNISITQFYYGSVHPQTVDFALAGSQDNGTEAWNGTNGWTLAGFGDGGETAISPNDPDNKWVVSLDQLQIVRQTGAGQFQQGVFSAGDYNLPNVPFIARLALAPANEDILLTGAGFLIKSTNFFSAGSPSWIQDSPDLKAPITALAFAPSDRAGNTYAFGTADGKLGVTSTGSGFDAANVNAGGAVPSRYVTGVAFHPNNPNILYVTLSGFDEGTPGKQGHLFKTANALAAAPTWANISPPVNLPHNSLVLDPVNPNNIYVGTDIGVWSSTDGGGSWNHMGPETGMPNVAVFDMKIQGGTGRIFAFTHGRGAFMYDPNALNNPPVVTSFSPTNGPAGTSVTITGAKFNNALSVKFGGVDALNFKVNGSTEILTTVPAGAVSGLITITTPTGSASSATTFTVSSMPAITGFVPAAGNIGTVVTISGANFTGATNVTFGGVSATIFTVDSANQITATVPGAAVTGKIGVSTPGGANQSGTVFTVTVTPVISSFTPSSGAIASRVTINGANFINVSSVAFNGIGTVNPTINSSSRITASVPTGASTGPITVTTAAGTAQSIANFVVIPTPAITSFSPATGSAGTIVTIVGINFAGATSVNFNGLNATSFNVPGDSQIIATAPSGVSIGPLRVTTPGGTAVSASSFTALPPPANDNFTAAQVITGNSGSASGNTVAATKETGEPNHAGNDGGKSIWYRWTAPSTGVYTFNTVGSSFDTLLALYTGSSLANLTAVASNDNIPGTNTSSVSFSANAGTVYQIAIDGFVGDAGEFGTTPTPASGASLLNWNLSISIPPQIASFSPVGGSLGSTVILAGVGFVGVTSVTFNGASANFNVDSDQQISTTVPIGASSGPIQVSKPSGTATSPSNFAVTPAPANDNFANAQALTGNSGTVLASNVGASKQPGEPNHAGNPGGTSVWFAWTAPSNGNWRFNTIGSSFDTLLAIYSGTSVSTLSLVASNDDSGNSVSSQLSFDAAAGTNYRIAVDGHGGVSGNVVLNWALTGNLPVITGFTPPSGGVGTSVTINGTSLNGASAVGFGGANAPSFTVNPSGSQIAAIVPVGASTGPISITTSNGTAQSANNFVVSGNAPSNDNFANRAVLNGTTVTITASNGGATKEANEPNHAGNAGGSSVWWIWTAPNSGTYTVTTRGSDFDTTLGVYTGSSLATLFEVDSDDDGPNIGTASLLSFQAVAGTVYSFAVDGYDGAEGNIVLSVYPATIPLDIYYTGFEAAEGYNTSFALAGQNSWKSFGGGQNGIVFDYFYDLSQQAYVGFSSPVPGTNLYVWPTLNITPDTNTRPVIAFSTFMEIIDSSNLQFDDFGWTVYNRNGINLLFLDFDNYDLGIYYQLNDSPKYYSTGKTFQNGHIYYLEVTMDFARNIWSAYLDGDELVRGAPLSAAPNTPHNLGDIDATWLQANGTAGDNYMLFDDYYVTSEPSQVPRIVTPPQDQAITLGNNAEFVVVADSDLELGYQWRFNGVAIPGATTPVLFLPNVSSIQAGSYSVIVSNSAGTIVAGPAALTIAQLPNLINYKPSGWSDKIVTATTPGTNDAPRISPDQDIYVSWAVLNDSTNGNINSRFYSQLFLDGQLNQTWFNDGLKADFYSYVVNYDIGRLPAGTHTLRLDTDTTSVVAESNENDNSYTKTFVVISTNAVPAMFSSFSVTNGQFQLTLSGTPGRAYEIQVSTNLINWSVLTNLVNTNASGILQFVEPVGPNFSRRFYRSHLLP
jgi:hypothetical protein